MNGQERGSGIYRSNHTVLWFFSSLVLDGSSSRVTVGSQLMTQGIQGGAEGSVHYSFSSNDLSDCVCT